MKANAGFLSLSLLVAFALPGHAAPMTGADIFASSNSTFPGTQPTLNGSSLVFGAGPAFGSPQLEKLWRYLLLPTNALPSTGPVLVSATINFTRLACDTAFVCADGQNDFDPQFAFGSGMTGKRYVSGVSDGGNGTTGVAELQDTGAVGVSFTSLLPVPNTGYPQIGESDTLTITLGLTDTTTTINGIFRAAQFSYTWNEIFPRADELGFFLFRDNENGERYQINTVEFVLPATDARIPEPATLALLGIGVAWLALRKRS